MNTDNKVRLSKYSDFTKSIIRFVFFILLIIIIIIGYNKINRINFIIEYDKFVPNNVDDGNIIIGKYKLSMYGSYNFQRYMETILYKNIPSGTGDAESFVTGNIENQIITNGWQRSSFEDGGSTDCYFLIPEYELLRENGYSVYAYRRENFIAQYDNPVGDLICLSVSSNEEKTHINVILLIARPTIIEYIMGLISS
ncbi:MAG: hypothetical protein JEZ00_22015 [Anaerolineaceae bacterium]|nr:hypothetical protein [Anaerolineaceae bacterium]